MYHLSHSVVRSLGMAKGSSLRRVSQAYSQGASWDCSFIWGLSGEGFASKHRWYWQHLTECLWIVRWRTFNSLLCGPSQYDYLFLQSQLGRICLQGSTITRQIIVLRNVMMEVVAHHFCHILLVRRKPQLPPIPRGVIRWGNTRRQGSWGSS